jgi:hypothetical protein
MVYLHARGNPLEDARWLSLADAKMIGAGAGSWRACAALNTA